MFSCLCTMNHSCTPNCLVAYDTTTAEKMGGPAEACIFATKDIAPGEELTISYIDASLPLRERRELLAHYGFECQCSKCQFEDPKHRLPRSVLVDLGSTAEREERYQDAAEVYTRLLQLNPRDGDAYSGLGRAYLNLGQWAKGGAAFRRGLLLCPDHEGLRRQQRERQAYYGGERKLPAAVFHPDAWVAREASGGHWIHTTPGVFTPEECAMAIREAEAHAGVAGGWSTQRHYSVPTTDVPIHEVPALRDWFNQALEERLLPMLAAQYADAKLDQVRVHDAFLVKYDAKA